MAKTLKPPSYVRLGHSTLRYRQGDSMWGDITNKTPNYFRDAGYWQVGFRWNGGKLYSVSDMEWLNNVELIPTTRKEYLKDNKGYV